MVHSVISFRNLPLIQALTLLAAQIVTLVFHLPTVFSFDLSCMGDRRVFIHAFVFLAFRAFHQKQIALMS